MERARHCALPRAIDDLRNRLSRWRSIQTKRRPIPEDLWREAAELARKQGISQVANALRLGYYGLKKRAEGLRSPPAVLKQAAFVEIEGVLSVSVRNRAAGPRGGRLAAGAAAVDSAGQHVHGGRHGRARALESGGSALGRAKARQATVSV